MKVRFGWHAITSERARSATIRAWNIPPKGALGIIAASIVLVMAVLGLWNSVVAWGWVVVGWVVLTISHYTKITIKGDKATKAFVTLWIPYNREEWPATQVSVHDEDALSEPFENDWGDELSRFCRTYKNPDAINIWLDDQARRLAPLAKEKAQ